MFPTGYPETTLSDGTLCKETSLMLHFFMKLEDDEFGNVVFARDNDFKSKQEHS